MERPTELSYLVGKAIRRGTATYSEMSDVAGQYGARMADSLAMDLSAAGVRLLDEKDLPITSKTNVLMNGLRLEDLVSLALRLPLVPKTPRRLHRRILQERSYELDLKRLDYLDSDYEWYYLSPAFTSLQRAIRRLFDSGQIPFSKEWRTAKSNLAFLRCLQRHPVFAERILPRIREHYLGLREIRLLIHWIKATERADPVMVDIVQAGLKESRLSTVRSMLLSSQASTAEAALNDLSDVCFICPRERQCLPLRRTDDPQKVLMEYRHSGLDTLLSTEFGALTPAQHLSANHLLLKFFVPYSIVVSGKSFMVSIGCLDDSTPILRKNNGKYCPRRDRWSITLSMQAREAV